MTFLRADAPGIRVDARAGRVARVARGLYTDDLTTPVREQIERGWAQVASMLVPGAVITARCGPTGRPVDGVLFVAGGRTRPLALPGLTIVTVPGPGPQPSDAPVIPDLWWASEPRWLVDNARDSRSIDGRPPATLSRTELHEHIARIVGTRTPQQVERILEAADEYATSVELHDQGRSVSVFIESARGERPTVNTGSPAMLAAQAGHSVDAARLETFTAVASYLAGIAPQVLSTGPEGVAPFFEAYFSNFIEGTEFTVDEAREIVEDGQIPEERPEDAHDILGTHAAIVDPVLAGAVANNPTEFVDLVRARHRLVMEGRPTKLPGEFKDRMNRAGSTEFVAPHLVDGTLREGWRIGQELLDPFARAVFTMFLVSEVHPFIDGNGRVARLTMNAELTAATETRIVLPTILRSDYMSALVKTTVHATPVGLVTVLGFARRHSAQMDYTTFRAAVRMLTATNAFDDAREAERAGRSLLLPTALDPSWRYGG